MSGLENILSDFLSSPENMRMLTDMASSMGIDLPGEIEEAESKPVPVPQSSPLELFTGFDKGDDTSALLRALKPFLSEAMAQRVESTVTAARIAQAAGGFLSKMSPETAGGR